MKYLMKSNSFAESKRYLKTFEKIWVGDYRIVLRDAIIIFFYSIYGDLSGFNISTEAGAGIEVSMKKQYSKEVWCDIDIRSVDYQKVDSTEVKFDFFLYCVAQG